MVKLISQAHKHLQRRNLSYVTIRFDPAQALASSVSSSPWFCLLGLCDSLRALRKVHGALVVHGLGQDRLRNTKLIGLYGRFGWADVARSVFDAIPDPDPCAWKVMLRWYFLNNFYSEMIGFYEIMRARQGELDCLVFSMMLKACGELRCLEEGLKLHCQILKSGSPDTFVLTGLVDVYAKCGEIESARRVFDENDDKSVVSWTSMIAGYVRKDQPREGLLLFNRMREELRSSNEFTLESIFTACRDLGALHQGRWAHGYVIKSGIELSSQLVRALLDMYAKCGVVGDARRIFDELSSPDIVLLTEMIVCYTLNGHPKEALKLFTDKERATLLRNDVTLSSVISACAKSANLGLGRSVHGVGVKLGLEGGFVANALMDMYAKCHMNRDARCLFRTIPAKDVVAWNSLISGFTQSGSPYEALELFHQMLMESVLPDAVTLVSALRATASLGALSIGCSLHAYSVKNGLFSSNIHVGTALLTFYSECGDANSARSVFNHMAGRNAVTWSAMIRGYGVQGDHFESLKLFAKMLEDRVEPNEVIFTNILSACSCTGMVEEGRRLFNAMRQEYGISPSMKHYVCMVDLLARAGRLGEAMDLIDKMPIQPDAGVYGAFLHGCSLHSRFDFGELVIRRMLTLNPNEACYYVLMCNLYASDGRWAQVMQARELIKQLGLVKSPGHSLSEIPSTSTEKSLAHIQI